MVKKVGVVLAIAAFFAVMAVMYSRFGESSGRRSDRGVGESLELQAQVAALKQQLSEMTEEIAKNKKCDAELSLRKEELKVCASTLGRVRKDRDRADKWGVQRDERALERREQVKAERGKRREEEKRNAELSTRVDAITAKLSATKMVMADIEKRKEESVKLFQEQKDAFSKLRDEMTELRAKRGNGKEGSKDNREREQEIAKLIAVMNKELRQKSQQIQELTKQKKASDNTLRRLEGKLVEAGVDPQDMEKATARVFATGEPPSPFKGAVNPAAAAMMQVGAGSGRERTAAGGAMEMVFEDADKNGDKSIDYDEFVARLKPEYALRAKKDGNAESFLKQRFRRLDTDHSGYVTKEEARAHPRQFVKFLVSPANVQRAGGVESLGSDLMSNVDNVAGAGTETLALAKDAAQGAIGLFKSGVKQGLSLFGLSGSNGARGNGAGAAPRADKPVGEQPGAGAAEGEMAPAPRVGDATSTGAPPPLGGEAATAGAAKTQAEVSLAARRRPSEPEPEMKPPAAAHVHLAE